MTGGSTLAAIDAVETFYALSTPARTKTSNEMRDVDAGGPAKMVIRPVPLRDEEFVFIDRTQPIRAVYFPIAHRSEESVPNLYTYLMVEFRKSWADPTSASIQSSCTL